jgi:hypothetical protein
MRAHRFPIGAALTSFALLTTSFCRRNDAAGPAVDFKLEVFDDHEAPLACRLHLRQADGTIWKSAAFPAFDDHFVFPGTATFPLPAGAYAYEVERGPEYRSLRGSFHVPRGGANTLGLHLERIADLAEQGWYSGDLHIHRKMEDVPLLMQAEDLHVAPVVTWWNSIAEGQSANLDRSLRFDGGRPMGATAGEDERWGGALLFLRLTHPLKLPPSMTNERGQIAHRQGDERDEYPAPAELAYIAGNQPGAHVDIEKPFWWDVPTWVGLGVADSIEIAYNQMTRTSLHNGEAWGKKRDADLYGGPLGNAYWGQSIYYRILDTGVRLAPSAGSASGALPNPVGYNRVYVHLDGPFDDDGWWQGLKEGHSFVTNGPLLMVSANGFFPGHVFAGDRGAKIDVSLDARVLSNEPLGPVEVIRDGRVVETASDSERGFVRLAPLSFQQSGWFLVRTIANRNDNFRFASTAPFYVQIEPSPRRISRASVQFFIDWIGERMSSLRASTMSAEKLESVLAFHRDAMRFWQEKLARANAD